MSRLEMGSGGGRKFTNRSRLPAIVLLTKAGPPRRPRPAICLSCHLPPVLRHFTESRRRLRPTSQVVHCSTWAGRKSSKTLAFNDNVPLATVFLPLPGGKVRAVKSRRRPCPAMCLPVTHPPSPVTSQKVLDLAVGYPGPNGSQRQL